ncbi:MAG: hypothetical protein ACE37F_10720 [Nannocystaceae bacterium]|nr:hypothetical protein [bacterium]
MDFATLTSTTGQTLAIVLAAVAVGASAFGLLATSTGRARRAQALGHPLVALITAALLVAVGALGQWLISHAVIDATFAPVDDGLRRVAGTHVDATAAMTSIASLQRTVAICVAVLVPLSWVAAWRHELGREPAALGASVASVFALSLPVLAGCGGVMWMADAMLVRSSVPAAIWTAWHALEASKWAVAGTAAVGLMAATPIVMHAASTGHVVSPRTSQLCAVMLLVGLAAWSTSRFANEDLVRGPMTALDRGEGAQYRSTQGQELPTLRGVGELPTASRCAEHAIDPQRHRALELVLDAVRTGTVPQWRPSPPSDRRETVLVAAVDRRARPEVYEPALLRAQALGVERVALVTVRDDTEQTLTLGTIHTESPCVLGWMPLSQALRLSSSGSSWTTLAYAASHARR